MEPTVAVEWGDPILEALRTRLAQHCGPGASLEVATDRATITLAALA